MNDPKKRVTSRSMRNGHSGKHNDRQFNIDHAGHINDTRDNIYWNIYDGEYKTGGQHQYSFDETEKKYYTDHYSAALELQNDKYKKNRQYKRCKTIDDILYSAKSGPDETILQIGSKQTGGTDRNILIDCVHKFLATVEERYKQYHVLNYAFHFDETTDHIHLRGVFDYTDKNGNLKVGQKEALKQMGIQCPNVGNEDTRYNNRKMTFSQELRETWQQIVIAHGIDIETEPLEQGKIRIPTNQYKAEQEQKHYDELKKQVKDIQQAEGNLEQREQTITTWQDEIEQREQSLSQLEEDINSREDIAFQKEQELNQRIESADAEIQRQNARKLKAKQQADKMILAEQQRADRAITDVQQQIDEMNSTLDSKQKQFDEIKHKLNTEHIELKDRNDNMKTEINDKMKQLDNIDSTLRNKTKELNKRLELLDQVNSDIQDHLQTAIAEFPEFQGRTIRVVDEINKNMTQLNKAIDDMER